MKLISLTMNHFRQFYGEQNIQFSDNEKNITIIIGENGNGKTGIFRAISYALFNEKTLEKDNLNTKSKQTLYLVNINRLQEKINEPISATVSLVFEHGDFEYTISRSTYDVMDNKGKIMTNIDDEVELIIKSLIDGTKRSTRSEREIQNIIDDIISFEIKDLFFFDGDKIESLSTVNDQSKLEIKNGVLKLLNIDVVTKLSQIVSKIIKDQRLIIKKSANTKLQVAEQKLTDAEGQLKDLKVDLSGYKALHANISRDIENNKKTQEKTSEIEQLFKDKQLYIQNSITNQQLVDMHSNQLKQMINTNSFIPFLYQSFKRIYDYILEVETKESFDSNLTLELINDILEKSVCICGQHLSTNHDFLIQLKEIKTKQQLMDTSEFLRVFKSKCIQFIDQLDRFESQFVLAMHNYKTVKSNQVDIAMKIQSIDEEIAEASKDVTEMKEVIETYNALMNQVNEVSEKMIKTQYQIEIVEKQIQSFKADIRTYSKDDQELTRNVKKFEYYEELAHLLSQVGEEYANNMRNTLSNVTTSIFKSIISEKDLSTINKIVISDTYEIGSIGWSGNSIFNDLSTGQKQMLSLSFVTALAKVASHSESHIIQMPLFMDTPFAKLDIQNRSNLINVMPGLTTQWILLLTNSEFTPFEASSMKKTEKIGRMYHIEKIRDGYSRLNELNINEDLSFIYGKESMYD